MIALLLVMVAATLSYFGMVMWLPVWAPLVPVY